MAKALITGHEIREEVIEHHPEIAVVIDLVTEVTVWSTHGQPAVIDVRLLLHGEHCD